jgi:hypothetical protein
MFLWWQTITSICRFVNPQKIKITCSNIKSCCTAGHYNENLKATRTSMDARIADKALIIDELKEEKMTPNLTILQKSSTFGAKIKKWKSFLFY